MILLNNDMAVPNSETRFQYMGVIKLCSSYKQRNIIMHFFVYNVCNSHYITLIACG